MESPVGTGDELGGKDERDGETNRARRGETSKNLRRRIRQP